MINKTNNGEFEEFTIPNNLRLKLHILFKKIMQSKSCKMKKKHLLNDESIEYLFRFNLQFQENINNEIKIDCNKI